MRTKLMPTFDDYVANAEVPRVSRIYRRYILANQRHDVDWSARWYHLLERTTLRERYASIQAKRRVN